MTAALLAGLAFLASFVLFRSQRHELAASYKQLSPAVPDIKAIEGAPYRGGAESSAIKLPRSRRSIEVLASTKRTEKVQYAAALAAAPLAVIAFALWPLEGLGALSGLIGLPIGLGMGASALKDKRRALGVMAMMLLPLAFVSPWASVACVGLYGALRTVLDMKDSAAMDEAERERLADPRYLAGSTERRAGRVAMSRGGGGDITAPSARDNSKG